MKTILPTFSSDSAFQGATRFATALALSVFLAGCKKSELAAPPPPIVEVMEVVSSEVSLTSTIIGQLDSPQNVDVRARVEGFVGKIPFIEGVEVKQGDVLFELDQKPFLERLAAATGALEEAKAALNKYQKDVDRLTPLAEKRAIPQQDLDNALASVDVGKAGVLTAQARVESAQLDLGYCIVKAPVTGLIGAHQVSIGDLVGKGEPTLLATISSLDPIWFYSSLSEVDYIKAQEKSLATGRDVATLPLTLIMAEGKEHPDQGRFVFIDRAVDSKTGTLRVRAEFPNKDKILRPGMFARVRVELGSLKGAIEIPQRALVEIQEKTFVWIVTPDNKASQRPVIVGDLNASNVIIREGLKPGERIIVEGLQKVREGMVVNPVAATGTATTQSAPAAGDKPSEK